jgi:hypothetical protein
MSTNIEKKIMMYFPSNYNFLLNTKENWPLIVITKLQKDFFFPLLLTKDQGRQNHRRLGLFLLPTLKDRLLPNKSVWQAQSCIEGVVSREVN